MSLWSCATCSKTFARKGDLTRHELLHTGIKPHVCETCGKGFAQFSGLKTHRNVHTKAKPFICGINTCKKAFADPSSCARHRKETHMQGGGPFKCFITDCGTSIKRRSTFIAHLRKHGIDTSSCDIKAFIAQMSEKRIIASAHLASPDVENGSHYTADSQGASSFLGDSSGYDTTGNGGETNHFMDNNGLPDDGPFDCRRANWSAANDVFLLDSNLVQSAQVGPSGLAQDIYPYLSSTFENPSCFDDIFFPKVDHSLLSTSPLNLPVLEPLLPEAASDGFQSSSSSPASTYSTLYPTDFNDDMISRSLADSASQEALLYNIV